MGAKRITESGYENISSFPSIIIVCFLNKLQCYVKRATLVLVHLRYVSHQNAALFKYIFTCVIKAALPCPKYLPPPTSYDIGQSIHVQPCTFTSSHTRIVFFYPAVKTDLDTWHRIISFFGCNLFSPSCIPRRFRFRC